MELSFGGLTFEIIGARKKYSWKSGMFSMPQSLGEPKSLAFSRKWEMTSVAGVEEYKAEMDERIGVRSGCPDLGSVDIWSQVTVGVGAGCLVLLGGSWPIENHWVGSFRRLCDGDQPGCTNISL